MLRWRWDPGPGRSSGRSLLVAERGRLESGDLELCQVCRYAHPGNCPLRVRACTRTGAPQPHPRRRTRTRAPHPHAQARSVCAALVEWPRPDLSPSRFCVHPLGRGRAPRFCAVLRPSDAPPGGPGTVSPAVRPPSDQPLPPVFPRVDTGESSQLSPRPAAAVCTAASSLGVRLPRASWTDDGSFRAASPVREEGQVWRSGCAAGCLHPTLCLQVAAL